MRFSSFLDGGGQDGVVVRLGQVHAHKLKNGSKAGKLFSAGALGQIHLVKAGLNQCAVLFVAEVVAPHTNNATSIRQSTVAKRLEQSGHQFAPGQVAGAAKQD